MDDFIAKILGAALAGALLPYLGSWLIAGYDRLFRDLPRIQGKWKTEYKYVREGKDLVDASETGKIARNGRYATAHMRMEGEIKKEWILTGEMRGRYWAGTVFSAETKTLSGSGVFQLKVLENGRKMFGYMSWYDAELDQIYSTEYRWTNVSTEADV